MTRTQAGENITIYGAMGCSSDRDGSEGGTYAVEGQGNELIMPHNIFSSDVLDKRYPLVEVPDEVDVGDPDDPDEDPMYKSGINTVAGRMYNLSVQFWRRKLSEIGGDPNKPG